MDIHKPKPFHGWREFLKEYGIIVLGVLTALALEQAVEWLHWQYVVGEERVALNLQSEHIYRAMLARVDLQTCVDTRLTDIATILKRHDAGEPLGINGPVGRPSTFYANASAFDMALADQSFSHMATDEKEKYFNIRGIYQTFRTYADGELDVWRTLKALDHAQTFTPGEWVEIRKAYDRADDLNEVLKTNLRMETQGQWLVWFKGFPTPKAVVSLRSLRWVNQLCQPSIVK